MNLGDQITTVIIEQLSFQNTSTVSWNRSFFLSSFANVVKFWQKPLSDIQEPCKSKLYQNLFMWNLLCCAIESSKIHEPFDRDYASEQSLLPQYRIPGWEWAPRIK